MAFDLHVALTADLRGPDGEAVFDDFGLEALTAAGIGYHYFERDARPVQADQLRDCDAVISMGQPYTAASFDGVERLTLIARAGVGYDMIDLEAATRADVLVTITPDATRRPVASATLALLLALCHRVCIKDRLVREHRWGERFQHMGGEVRDRVAGLIGLGLIGREVVRLLKPFAPARILAVDPAVPADVMRSLGVERVDLDTLLRTSDIVSVHCPLSERTRGMIGARELALMKPTAFIINTARGPIIDQAALTEALQRRAIQGAALDVFEEEPVAPDDPLLALDNVILAPHAAAWTYELFRDIGHDCARAALAVARGEAPPHVVNTAVLDRPGLRAKLDGYRRAWAHRTPS